MVPDKDKLWPEPVVASFNVLRALRLEKVLALYCTRPAQ